MYDLLVVLLVLLMFTHCPASISRRERPLISRILHHTKTPECLNGGRSVSTLLDEQHMFCLCLKGFSGTSCEIDNAASCIVGMGLQYRGPVGQTESGQECLEWDHGSSLTLGLGRHNRCRNPDYNRKPWCYVKGPSGKVKEYCNIPECLQQTGWRCGERTGPRLKIVGGSLSTVESHPWVAAVFWKSRSEQRVFRCAGSLVDPCWILTAAHCFPDGAHTNTRRLLVVLGKNVLNETDQRREQEFRLTELHTHQHFDDSDNNYNNDIALLKISGPGGVCAVESNSVRTVCVPPPDTSLLAGTTCQIAGYGKEQQGLWYNSQYLREGKVNLLPQDVCSSKSYYGKMITDNMLCAAAPDWNVDTCKGDSGGPLVCSMNGTEYVYGVVSWGEGCSRKFRPGVYTRVTNYHHWILKRTSQLPKTRAPADLQE